jgi:hypothetical protein
MEIVVGSSPGAMQNAQWFSYGPILTSGAVVAAHPILPDLAQIRSKSGNFPCHPERLVAAYRYKSAPRRI